MRSGSKSRNVRPVLFVLAAVAAVVLSAVLAGCTWSEEWDTTPRMECYPVAVNGYVDFEDGFMFPYNHEGDSWIVFLPDGSTSLPSENPWFREGSTSLYSLRSYRYIFSSGELDDPQVWCFNPSGEGGVDGFSYE